MIFKIYWLVRREAARDELTLCAVIREAWLLCRPGMLQKYFCHLCLLGAGVLVRLALCRVGGAGVDLGQA